MKIFIITLVSTLVATVVGGIIVALIMAPRPADTSTSLLAQDSATTSSPSDSRPASPTTTAEAQTSGEGTVAMNGSASATSAYLADMQPTATGGYGIRAQAAAINGTSYPHAILSDFDAACEKDNSDHFNIARGWKTFNATLGMADEFQNSDQVKFEVYGDNALLYTSPPTGYGAALPISINVSGVLDLEVRSLWYSGQAAGCDTAGQAVWGDPVLHN